MRVVVVGGTGNVGTGVLRALLRDPAGHEVVAVARRLPRSTPEGVRWHAADVRHDPLDVVAGADVVVHVAWMIQPQHRPDEMARTNVLGTRRVAEAVVQHGVRRLVVASSVGAYAPGPKDPPVDETWPATGAGPSAYARQKAAVEADLDAFEAEHPDIELVRMRTSLVFQRAAGAEVRRIFLGPLAPRRLPHLLRVVPGIDRLRFQATSSDDIGEAYRLVATAPGARGAYNVAAEPVLDPARIAAVVGGRVLPVPAPLLRAAADVTFRLHLQPTEAGWLDMALGTPLMATDRIRALGWAPTASAEEALAEVLAGMGEGTGTSTPPLAPWRQGPELPVVHPRTER